MKCIIKQMLSVFLILSLLNMDGASASEFFSSSELFSYFLVENLGLMEVDMETDEVIIYDAYVDLRSIVTLDSGDLLLNTGYEIIRTDLLDHDETLFEISDPDSDVWIYHMKRFGNMIYFATTDFKIYEMEQDGTNQRALTDNAYLYDFTVNSTDLYFCDGTAMYMVDLNAEDCEPQILINDIVTAVESYDGKVYFVYGTNRALCRLGDSENLVTEIIHDGVRDFTLFADGKLIAYIDRTDSSLKIFEIESNSLVAKISAHCVDLAADGKELFFKTMQEGKKTGELTKYSIYEVGSDYTAVLIGDD